MIDKSRGCLVGQLVGDALGSQAEFLSSRQIIKFFPDGLREISISCSWDTLPGQITDDSEMALALARTLIKTKKYDQQATRRAYLEWLRSDPFDCGNTVRSALHGKPNPYSQANGALMRISPLGIWGIHQDRKTVWQAAKEDALLTHIHPICQQVNQIFVTLIVEAICSKKNGVDLYKDLCLHPENYCSDPFLPEVEVCIEKAETDKPVLDSAKNGWVLLAFQNALYQLNHARTFEQALVDSVMGGGDTDTNGAICGALMGAVFGYESIPEAWSSKVLNCKPDKAHNAKYPRPKYFWATDALTIVDVLMV
ncbi:MAG: ADP-ribosylglycohydrolase family protein [Mailhella sp.]|nr:ADP-ribosylglycohydrolase family protein [Mailhella sp.]